jgi:hypothetical protein
MADGQRARTMSSPSHCPVSSIFTGLSCNQSMQISFLRIVIIFRNLQSIVICIRSEIHITTSVQSDPTPVSILKREIGFVHFTSDSIGRDTVTVSYPIRPPENRIHVVLLKLIQK